MKFDENHIAPIESLENADEAIGHLLFLEEELWRHEGTISICKRTSTRALTHPRLKNIVQACAYMESYLSELERQEEHLPDITEKIKGIKEKFKL